MGKACMAMMHLWVLYSCTCNFCEHVLARDTGIMALAPVNGSRPARRFRWGVSIFFRCFPFFSSGPFAAYTASGGSGFFGPDSPHMDISQCPNTLFSLD